MIDDVEKQIYEVAFKFTFIEKAETLLKTPNTIKIKLSVTPTCFIQIYQNIQKGIKSYVLVSGNQRLFGRDCDGGAWHCHPVENPDSHDFSEDGSREVSFEDFLYEAGEKLVLLGIL
ncbi:MAG: hypothetical protein M0Z64_07390 [Nitrospiraceae bacterium]|jgi:hypothetical protein|nr:hypothetical protein [Nitrospiraceae bacterium]